MGKRTPLEYGAPAFSIRVERLDYAGMGQSFEFDGYGLLEELLTTIRDEAEGRGWLSDDLRQEAERWQMNQIAGLPRDKAIAEISEVLECATNPEREFRWKDYATAVADWLTDRESKEIVALNKLIVEGREIYSAAEDRAQKLEAENEQLRLTTPSPRPVREDAMTSKDFVQPAFPEGSDSYGGMSLRDYFAAQAMSGFAWHRMHPADMARHAYEAADAMLAQRAALEAALGGK